MDNLLNPNYQATPSEPNEEGDASNQQSAPVQPVPPVEPQAAPQPVIDVGTN